MKKEQQYEAVELVVGELYEFKTPLPHHERGNELFSYFLYLGETDDTEYFNHAYSFLVGEEIHYIGSYEYVRTHLRQVTRYAAVLAKQ